MRPEERPFTCVEMNLEAASTSNVLDERTGEQWGQDNPVREAISRGEVGKRGYLPAETVGRRQKMIRYPGGEKIARWGQDVSLQESTKIMGPKEIREGGKSGHGSSSRRCDGSSTQPKKFRPLLRNITDKNQSTCGFAGLT